MYDYCSAGRPGPRLFPSPYAVPVPSCVQLPAGPLLKTQVNLGSAYLFPYELGQEGEDILTSKRQINFLMDGGPGFPAWRDSSGAPWKKLIENGTLDADTQEAVKFFQTLCGLAPTGRLCLPTRTLLYPYLRLRGHLHIEYPPLSLRRPGSPSHAKPVPKPAPKPVPKPGHVPPAVLKPESSEDEAKPWHVKVLFTHGFGFDIPIYAGPHAESRPKPGADFDVDLDLALPTSAALGQGHLTLYLSTGLMVPLEPKYRPVFRGTFRLGADDIARFGKRKLLSLSAFASGGVRHQEDLWSGTGRFGLELKIRITKHLSLKFGAGIGVQGPTEDAKVEIPFQGDAAVEVE